MSIAARKALTQRQGWLERLFHLSEYDTDVRTEISAGITTFMTMAYVMIVHPRIMAAAGMPVAEMAVVTAITSGLFTLMMGLYATVLPLAPAMGSNVFCLYLGCWDCHLAASPGDGIDLGMTLLPTIEFRR